MKHTVRSYPTPRKTWHYGLICALLVIASIVSVGISYLVYRYWYPPVLSFTTADFAKTVTLHTTKGDITIAIDLSAKLPAAQFTHLVRSGFYTGTRIHRAVPNLLIEGGDPLTKYESERAVWGEGGLSNAFKNEIHKGEHMTEGTVAFTSSGANTYGSVFFIVTKTTPWLDGKHTIIGHVIKGMDVVHLIEKTPTTVTSMPVEDIIITDITTL